MLSLFLISDYITNRISSSKSHAAGSFIYSNSGISSYSIVSRCFGTISRESTSVLTIFQHLCKIILSFFFSPLFTSEVYSMITFLTMDVMSAVSISGVTFSVYVCTTS